MSVAKDILDNMGMKIDAVEQSAAAVQQYKELRDREVELPSSIDVYGTTIHRFQIIREEIDMPMGSETTDWVVTDWDTNAKTITMKVPGSWDEKTITYEDLEMGDFEPLYVGDEPMWGY